MKGQKKELDELVNGCWETITGEVLPSHLFDSDPKKHFNKSAVNNSSSLLPNPVGDDEVEEIIPSSQFNDHSGDENVADIPPIREAVSTATKDPNTIDPPSSSSSSSGQSVLSSLISQILTGQKKPADVCVEGMPVNAIRRLVARQMSMASQLLVQILLQADERSECFTK